MPLLTTTTRANARITELGNNVASHLAAAAHAANEMVLSVMRLDDAQLADWLNAQGPELETLFEAHGQLGTAINGASQVAAGILSASGIEPPFAQVDVRSVPDKLAAQGRAIVGDASGWQVVRLPETETPAEEPAEEPQPEEP